MQPTPQASVFADAEHALQWSCEVLRRRRLPKLSSLWKEVSDEADAVARAWEGEKAVELPHGAVERLDLALKVEGALDELARADSEAARLLRLWAWGDWADEKRLWAALAMKEKLRRQGVHVRLSYRYSTTQLGRLLGCDRGTAWRRLQVALEGVGRVLVARGLVVVAPVMPWEEEGGREVRRGEFR